MLDTSYREARLRVVTVAAGLDETQLRAPVPATPGWSVHHLLAHLVGGAADAASGRLDGAGGRRWTARHAAERENDSVEALLAEWQRVAPVVEAGLAGQQFTGPNLAADLICHEADLNEALNLPPVDRGYWQAPFLNVMMWLLVQRLRPLTSILIRDEHGSEWCCATDTPALTLHADGYELFRAMFSRRSRRQIAAWNWAPTPAQEVIDSLGFFGPRDDDQPLPCKPKK
ncbi:hypothetical protein ACT17_15970 [Mycolicibacterium conceptionense]|jgi:uncharacterized protein (TIGR03083 family)|uniref:Mycothiol-dependent maleylpyruvate isomerase metal-binding domain-containing protein n=2 Tax=Mycolicibacterium TaxID=1866885 RepID=A0ABR5FYK8_9MYCO|nr:MULTISPECIES: maleylpyruvate isomerase N-terminal domain-containing protein [Mycolicibacterium]KLI09072.1 hypothetical protein AA982_06380 [Mycolicibacterium senegalense]KLO52850.1 hypothetical protein ABW05_16375 [Mycolicibacterium senegalense]KMV17423.1 hypothetical protein ACT17_15970 [Mycolicibacterium conceptionense]